MASPSLSPQPVPPRSRKGRRKERYELQEQVGAGGMGTVYRAWDRELNRTVAAKVLRPEFGTNWSGLLRLKRELVLAARVSDEHVVRVHDIGEVDGRALIAMDWVDGESLAHLLQRVHSLPPSQVFSFARQICQALRSIHAANIVHRDLKPANLLVRRDGALLVSDFGLARSVLPQDFSLSQPGESGGTPRYMAPEQLAGLPADARSDLYALGAVLLEMLTGTTALETLAPLRLRSLAAPGDKSRRSEELRALAALEVMIRRCLRLDRTERYATAGEALEDLELVHPESAVPVRPRTLWRWAWRAGLPATLLVLLLAGYATLRRHSAARGAESERTYAQVMSLITPQSGAPELRSALTKLNQLVADNPDHLSAARLRLETLIRLFERTHEAPWLTEARRALAQPAVARLSVQERSLFEARVDLQAGLFAKVIQALQGQTALLSSSRDANLLLGRALASSGQWDGALSCYRAAIRLSPESWRAHNDLGAAFLSLGRVDEARMEFAEVARLQPDSPVGYENLGSALLAAGKLEQARRQFELSLQRAASPEAYFNLGITAYFARQYATAIPFLEAAMRMRPGSDRYEVSLADVLRHLHRGEPARDHYSRALVLLDQAAQTRVLTPEEQGRRAICLARLGDLDAAASALDALASKSPDQDAAYARAILALVEGRQAAAATHLKDAVRLGYPAILIQLNPDLNNIP